MVNGDGGIDSGRFAQQTLARRLVQRRLDQRRNRRKTDASGDEFADGDLIGRIEHGWRRAAGLQGAPRQSKRRKPDQIGRLEGQFAHLCQIEPGRRPIDALRPRQTMGDRNAHIGRTELGHHRAIAEFDQPVDHRLRMDQNVDLVSA